MLSASGFDLDDIDCLVYVDKYLVSYVIKFLVSIKFQIKSTFIITESKENEQKKKDIS